MVEDPPFGAFGGTLQKDWAARASVSARLGDWWRPNRNTKPKQKYKRPSEPKIRDGLFHVILACASALQEKTPSTWRQFLEVIFVDLCTIKGSQFKDL